jgi:hypothetical protein
MFASRGKIPAPDAAMDPVRAVYAGTGAAFAYLLVMYADMSLTRSPSDDLLLLGRPFTSSRRTARLIGLPLHCCFGVGVALLYAAYGHRRLRGPDWLRGLTMLAVENTVLWPATFLGDRVHPAIVSGELPRLNAPVPAAQQVARHAAFGLVLGLIYGEGRRAAP